jgi:competence protein ComEA
MFFTPAERRLLTCLALLLGAGYLISALRHWNFLPAREVTPATDLCRVTRFDSSTWRSGPGPAQFVDGYLDLNGADSLSLIALPGIGPALSGRILERRRKQSFADLSELLDVKGIGPKRLARLRGYLAISPMGQMAAGHLDSTAGGQPALECRRVASRTVSSAVRRSAMPDSTPDG